MLYYLAGCCEIQLYVVVATKLANMLRKIKEIFWCKFLKRVSFEM